ncbi:hypothetical protein VTK56DRAFT_306 [Thermocarpiscus australiensis]
MWKGTPSIDCQEKRKPLPICTRPGPSPTHRDGGSTRHPLGSPELTGGRGPNAPEAQRRPLVPLSALLEQSGERLQTGGSSRWSLAQRFTAGFLNRDWSCPCSRKSRRTDGTSASRSWPLANGLWSMHRPNEEAESPPPMPLKKAGLRIPPPSSGHCLSSSLCKSTPPCLSVGAEAGPRALSAG